MINKELLRHELIGLKCRVVDARNHDLVGVAGKIIDETRNTLLLKKGDREKRIPKDGAVFLIALPDGEVKIKGSLLVGRPEDRVRKR